MTLSSLFIPTYHLIHLSHPILSSHPISSSHIISNIIISISSSHLISSHIISISSCNLEGRCARLSFSTFGLGVGVGDAFRVANSAFEKEKKENKKSDK